MIVMLVMGNQAVEDLEDNQDIVEDNLPDVFLIMVKIILMVKVMNLFWKEVTTKIAINTIRCMLILQNIKSKR